MEILVLVFLMSICAELYGAISTSYLVTHHSRIKTRFPTPIPKEEGRVLVYVYAVFNPS